MVTREQIEKCLDFAEGKKGKFTILMAKRPDFPETLLNGTEKQRIINEYLEKGYTTRQIAEVLNCTQPNIVEHMRQYRKGREFYDVWCEFWEFAKDMRKTPITVAFKDVLSCEEIMKYQSKGIETVEDYLRLAVTIKSRGLCGLLGEDNADTKGALFECMKQMCLKILTVSAES